MAFSMTVLTFLFIIGLVIGSFMNVVILRTVSEESIVFPASKCPKCQTPLKWYHNIPVLSYIFLRGKCAFCKEHISLQYPLVELLTGLIFVGLFIKFCNPFDAFFGLDGMNPIGWGQMVQYIFALIISCLFIAIAGTDILEKKVSDIHTYSLIGIGILYSIIIAVINLVLYSKINGIPRINFEFFMTCPVLYSIGATILGFLIMEAVSRLGLVLVGVRAFGEGDSYIAAGIGAVIGSLMGASAFSVGFLPIFKTVVAILVLSVILQIIVALPIFIKKLIVNKNWFTLGAIGTFILYTIGFVFAQNAGWFENMLAYWASTIVLFIIGILTCKELLIGMKEHKTEGLYLPFGPAMLVAGFIAMITLPM